MLCFAASHTAAAAAAVAAAAAAAATADAMMMIRVLWGHILVSNWRTFMFIGTKELKSVQYNIKNKKSLLYCIPKMSILEFFKNCYKTFY